MHLVITTIAVALLALPFTLEQEGILLPLPLGLFKFINPPPQGAPVPAVTTAATPTAVNVVSLDVIRSSHDVTVVQDYSRRGCIGSVFNTPLGCPCADPGKRCYDLLSKCNLENRCICDGTKGFASADKTRCIAYATTTTRTTTRTTASTTTTTTPFPTTSTTARTSTTTTTTTTHTTTTTNPFLPATAACKTTAPGSSVHPSVNICTTPTFQMPPDNGLVNFYVPNPTPKTSCTIKIDQSGGSDTNIQILFNEINLPAGGSGCSTGALQYESSPEYCATSCPANYYVFFGDNDPIDHVTFRVDATAAATVDPAVTPFFLKFQLSRAD